MKTTLLVPFYDKGMEDKKRELLARCISSFAGLTDEIIVIKDNELSQYKKLNIGMKMAHGDYVFISNDDAFYHSGNLSDMCIPNVMTKPTINGSRNHGWGHFFCLPKKVYKMLGKFDDSYEHGYFDDDDLQFSLEMINIPIRLVDTVDISHPDMTGTTLSKIPDKMGFFQRNKDRFLAKWGRLPG